MLMRLLCVRFAVHESSSSDDHPGRATVSECPQDVQQYQTVSARLHTYQRLVYRRWIRPPCNIYLSHMHVSLQPNSVIRFIAFIHRN